MYNMCDSRCSMHVHSVIICGAVAIGRMGMDYNAQRIARRNVMLFLNGHRALKVHAGSTKLVCSVCFASTEASL